MSLGCRLLLSGLVVGALDEDGDSEPVDDVTHTEQPEGEEVEDAEAGATQVEVVRAEEAQTHCEDVRVDQAELALLTLAFHAVWCC